MAMTYEVTVDERTFEVKIERDGTGYRIELDGIERRVQANRLGAALHLLVQGRSFDAGLARREDAWIVDILGTAHTVNVVDPRRKALRMASGAGAGLLKSSMPGRVVKVLVSEGDIVTRGQPVLVLEAMKMENELKAPMDGQVAHLFVADGDAVDTGAKLLELKGEE